MENDAKQIFGRRGRRLANCEGLWLLFQSRYLLQQRTLKQPRDFVENTSRQPLRTLQLLPHEIQLAYRSSPSLAATRRRTSAQGMVLALPESNSSMRRRISSFQAS